jgi:hypothetical protein
MTTTTNEHLGFHYKHQGTIRSITDRLDGMRAAFKETDSHPILSSESERAIGKWSSLLVNDAISNGDLDLLLAIDKFLGEQPWASAYILKATFTALRTAGHDDVLPSLTLGHLRRSKDFDRGIAAAGFAYGQITRWGEIEKEVKLLRAASIMGDHDTAEFINAHIGYLRNMMLEIGVDTAAALDEVLSTLPKISAPLRVGML